MLHFIGFNLFYFRLCRRKGHRKVSSSVRKGSLFSQSRVQLIKWLEFIYRWVVIKRERLIYLYSALSTVHIMIYHNNICTACRADLVSTSDVLVLLRFAQGLQLRQIDLLQDQIARSSRTLSRMTNAVRKVWYFFIMNTETKQLNIACHSLIFVLCYSDMHSCTTKTEKKNWSYSGWKIKTQVHFHWWVEICT